MTIIGDGDLNYAKVTSDNRLLLKCPDCGGNYSEQLVFKSAYDKAIEALKKISTHKDTTRLYSVFAAETLRELGESE